MRINYTAGLWPPRGVPERAAFHRKAKGRKGRLPTVTTDFAPLSLLTDTLPVPGDGAPMQRYGRVGMWRGGGRIGLSVSAPFVWRCLNSRAITPFPHPARRTGTCATHASGSRTRHHAFAHGRSRTVIRPTARAVVPRRTPIDWNAHNRQCRHIGRPWLPRTTPRFSLRFGPRSLPQLSHIIGVQ